MISYINPLVQSIVYRGTYAEYGDDDVDKESVKNDDYDDMNNV